MFEHRHSPMPIRRSSIGRPEALDPKDRIFRHREYPESSGSVLFGYFLPNIDELCRQQQQTSVKVELVLSFI